VVSGIHCAAFADILEAALKAVPGVWKADVSAASHRAVVLWTPNLTRVSALVQAMRQACYDAVPDTGSQARTLRTQERRTMLWRLFVAAFCSMQIMMLAWPSYTTQCGDLEADLAQLLNWSAWVLSLSILAFSAAPFVAGAWHAVRRRRLGTDVPAAICIAVCFVASSAATFSPNGALGPWFTLIPFPCSLLFYWPPAW
jgi:P-type Cu2+ transporter